MLAALAPRFAGIIRVVVKVLGTPSLGFIGLVLGFVRALMRLLSTFLAGFARALRIVREIA
jgi:hypothetical protein